MTLSKYRKHFPDYLIVRKLSSLAFLELRLERGFLHLDILIRQ